VKHDAIFHQRFAVVRQVHEHIRNARSIQRLDDLAQNIVNVKDGVVVGVEQLLDSAPIGDVRIVARWLKARELRRMPVAVIRAVTSAAKMQDDEPVPGYALL
jgi:hypothetical protein